MWQRVERSSKGVGRLKALITRLIPGGKESVVLEGVCVGRSKGEGWGNNEMSPAGGRRGQRGRAEGLKTRT